MFKKFVLSEPWRQFEVLDIDFHHSLTVLTGANGCGKTTILNLLSRHYGWSTPFVSTPKTNERGVVQFFTGLWKSLFDTSKDDNIVIGSITFSNDQMSSIRLPIRGASSYHVSFEPQKGVPGIHIPSHRPIYFYQQVSQIPTSPPTRSQMFQTYSNDIKSHHAGSGSGRSANSYIKEALIALANFGEGNKYVKQNLDAKETFEGFQEILRIVLPPKLGFKNVEVEMPEVVLVTDTGTFSLDAVSGGVAAIIDLAWQVYMGSSKGEKLVVTIDEPENHLHPEMQKSLLPSFLKAFPDIQFIIATHSPLIVSSVENSNVYVLNYNDRKRIVSTYLDRINKAGSSNDILREALGLSSTMPLWAEDALQKIIQKYAGMEFNDDNLKSLRTEMMNLGFDKVIPETIATISSQNAKAN
jgi:predicted ATPase